MCSTLKISQNLKSEKEVILVEFALPCLALRRARWSKWSVVTGFFSLLKRQAFSLLFPVCAHSCIISYNDAYWSQLANNAACLVLECLNNFIQWFRAVSYTHLTLPTTAEV